MKKTLLLFILTIIPVNLVGQVAADYFPLHIGNNWEIHSSPILGSTWASRIFTREIEGIDIINNQEYFRIMQQESSVGGSIEKIGYEWIKVDSLGNILFGGFGESTNIDSVLIIDPPLLLKNDLFQSAGSTLHWDLGGGIYLTLISISLSEIVNIPAGSFNCVLLQQITTDASGDTVMIDNRYYASGVGYVLTIRDYPLNTAHRSELVNYSIQTAINNNPYQVPKEYSLAQNYPNPFNPFTTIQYSLPQRVHVNIDVYNMQGQIIRTLMSKNKPAGTYNIIWDGHTDGGIMVASGIYIIQIIAGEFRGSKKAVFMK